MHANTVNVKNGLLQYVRSSTVLQSYGLQYQFTFPVMGAKRGFCISVVLRATMVLPSSTKSPGSQAMDFTTPGMGARRMWDWPSKRGDTIRLHGLTDHCSTYNTVVLTAAPSGTCFAAQQIWSPHHHLLLLGEGLDYTTHGLRLCPSSDHTHLVAIVSQV